MKLKRDAVHAIAKTGRRRAVIENVAEMAAATATVHFGSCEHEPVVARRFNGVRQRPIETRPTRAAVELRGRIEQPQIAACARVTSRALLLIERTRHRGFRAVVAQDRILIGVENSMPFFVGVADFKVLTA